MPSQLELRKQAAKWLHAKTYYEGARQTLQLIAIPIPRAVGVQWYLNDLRGPFMLSITPAIHALLTGRQLRSAHVGGSGGWDNWHNGIAMQAELDFRDPNLAEWLAEELRQCARTVSVGFGLDCSVQVLRLDGPSN